MVRRTPVFLISSDFDFVRCLSNIFLSHIYTLSTVLPNFLHCFVSSAHNNNASQMRAVFLLSSLGLASGFVSPPMKILVHMDRMAVPLYADASTTSLETKEVVKLFGRLAEKYIMLDDSGGMCCYSGCSGEKKNCYSSRLLIHFHASTLACLTNL